MQESTYSAALNRARCPPVARLQETEKVLDFYNTRANYSDAKIRNAHGAGNILAHHDM